MAVLLSPIFNLPAFTDANGDPLAGGKIFQYEAGSFSVLKTTYTTQDGNVANSNPIVLNSAGQLPAGVNIWLTENELYNLVLTQADGTTVIKSFDDVSGIIVDTGEDPNAIPTVWVPTVGASYQSPTTFLVPGNNVTQYAPGNRVRITLSAGFLYGVVSASTYTTPNTIVTIIPDSGTLNSSLTQAEYSVLTAVGPTVDAGAVSYTETLPYSTAGTVGNKIKAVEASITTQVNALNTSLTNQINPIRNYFTASSPAQNYYAVTIPNYQNQSIFMVSFPNAPSNGAFTYLNINGTGNRRILQMDYNGSYTSAVIKPYQCSQIVWDGQYYILLDPIPTAPFYNYQIPHGLWATGVVGSSAYFTVPADVYWLYVTVVGGGGGGQRSDVIDGSSFPYTYRPGNPGGGAAKSYSVINVSPGQVFYTTVGAGGLGGGVAPNYGIAGQAGGSSAFGGIYAAGGGANGVPGSYSGSNGNIVTPGGFGPSGFGPYGGNAYGSGGLGGVNGYAGGNGIPGLVMVEW
jgi:hypothetical protein